MGAPDRSEGAASDHVAGPPGAEVLAGGKEGSRLVARWQALSRRTRRTAVVAVVLGLAAALGPSALGSARAWWAERGLRDQLSVSAVLGVSSASSSPPGGRVDYYAALRNDSPRPATFGALTIAEARLRIRGVPGLTGAPVAAGGEVFVPLSVDLDCARPEPIVRRDELDGVLDAVAASGRRHRLPVVLQRAGPLTDVADTLCRLDPRLRIPEMSGPVSAVQAGTTPEGTAASEPDR